MLRRLSGFYEKYQNYLPAVFFSGGVAFDVVTLVRIDSKLVLTQQGIYLALIAGILAIEVMSEFSNFKINNRLQGVWQYHEEIVHFLFGALLSAFTVIYLKSTSLIGVFGFLSMIVILLFVNEIKSFRKYGIIMRVALFALCLSSYMFYLVPIYMGRVGFLPFAIALLIATLVAVGIFLPLKKRSGVIEVFNLIFILPIFSVNLALLGLYLLKLVPPVPISIQKIGIYHLVEKTADQYLVTHSRPWWKIWHEGDQSYHSKNGDRIYCAFRIYSPAGFEDQVKVRWLFLRGGDWQSRDSIPVAIKGGRENGYRGFTYKSNYEVGQWQIRVETLDDREIGRISFEVKNALSTKNEENLIEEF